MNLSTLKKATSSLKNTERMPVLFVGHGNPMNALEDNPYTRGWKNMVNKIPSPQAILCISAHWQTQGTKVLTSKKPKTIHDFYGFPQRLHEVEYPSPGSPELANYTSQIVKSTTVEADESWGLDHGTWSVLVKMYPEAQIPVYQISLDRNQGERFHYELGKELAALRRKGVLIIGSGNIVHNLKMAHFHVDKPYDWATEFDERVAQLILSKDHDSLIDWRSLGEAAHLSIPTNEHYLPLLYTLAMQEKQDTIEFYSEGIDLGSASMRSVRIG